MLYPYDEGASRSFDITMTSKEQAVIDITKYVGYHKGYVRILEDSNDGTISARDNSIQIRGLGYGNWSCIQLLDTFFLFYLDLRDQNVKSRV